MSQETLKWMRFITPALIILFFWAIIGAVTNLWEPMWPETPDQWRASLTYLIPAIIYYITPLREVSNRPYFRDVTDNLRIKLLKAAGVQDDPNVYSWKKIRGIFYYLIDNDTSLSTKARLAYFNGWVWTTLADVRAISIVLAVVFLILSVSTDIFGCFYLFVFFGVIGLFSFIASFQVTKLHASIGDEQIEIIEHYYLSDLKQKLEEVKNRRDT